MTLREFHNALRILIAIDRDELEAELGYKLSDFAWIGFRDHPLYWMIRANISRQSAVWRIVQRRQPAGIETE